jgi:internalin A
MMTNRQSAAILAFLALLYAVASVLLAPLHFILPGTASGRLSMLAAGAALASPIFLALWAALGRQRAAVRLPLTLWLFAALYLSLAYGESRVLGQVDADIILILGLGGFTAYLAMLLPLSLLRVTRGWRLESIAIPPSPTAENNSTQLVPVVSASGQFTIRTMLGWTLAAASILAGLRWLLPEGSFDLDDWPDALLAGLQGLVMAVAGLPVLSVAWIVLADGRRTVLRVSLAAITLVGIAGITVFWWWSESDEGLLELIILIEGGVVAAGLAITSMVRLCGYRLVRRSRKATQTANFATADSLSRAPWRFAFALCCLSAASAAVACYAPTRFEVWRQADESQRWAALGWKTSFDTEGRIDTLRCIGGRELTDGDIRNIAELTDLVTLDFSHSRLTDVQLGQLSRCIRLTTLNLQGTPISDAGLAHLDRFPNLTDLNLSCTSVTNAGLPRLGTLKHLKTLKLALTDVTDEGVAALSRLDEVQSFDLQLTAVTEHGARELQTARPKATVLVGASDALLSRALMIRKTIVFQNSAGVRNIGMSRAPLMVKRLHACGNHPYPVRTGPSNTLATAAKAVTDAGLKLLGDQAILEELDLRDAAVTDAGMPSLFKLTTLKRIDLRGTQVTQRGCQQLARALPNCQIVR